MSNTLCIFIVDVVMLNVFVWMITYYLFVVKANLIYYLQPYFYFFYWSRHELFSSGAECSCLVITVVILVNVEYYCYFSVCCVCMSVVCMVPLYCRGR